MRYLLAMLLQVGMPLGVVVAIFAVILPELQSALTEFDALALASA